MSAMSVFDHSHSGFSIRRLGRRIESLPALLFLIPFVVGITLHDSVILSWGIVVAALGISLLFAFMLHNRGYAPLFIGVAMLTCGYLCAELRVTRNDIPYGRELELVVELESIPADRGNYRTSEGRITAWNADSLWHKADSRVILWLRDDSIGEGDIVRLCGTLQERMSKFEPYDELLRRRGFVGGIGVDSGTISGVEHSSTTLHSSAVRHLEQYMRDSTAYATAEAMVVGSRRMITPELREAYSRTGLAHLMAVSGLHLGIVLLVVGWLLRPLVIIHRGLIPYNLLIIVALWVYAIMSGGSASVMRAALMFSVLHLSTILSRNPYSLNTLAAVVICMLVFDPNYLYDISFQLSVVAVAGIVTWGVPMLRALNIGRKPMSWLWSTIIISVVATLWTMPLVSHTFGGIPIAGIVVTPLAMITAYLILGFGIFALILPIPVAQLFVWCMERSAWLQNMVVERASWWPYSSIEYRMTEGQVAIIYALIVLITLGIWCFKPKKVVTLSEDDLE